MTVHLQGPTTTTYLLLVVFFFSCRCLPIMDMPLKVNLHFFPLCSLSFLLKRTHILGTLCDCDHIYPREQWQHKEEVIYFLHGFRGFVPRLLGLVYLGRTSWSLCRRKLFTSWNQEAENRNYRLILKGMPPVIFLPPLSLPSRISQDSCQ